MGFRVLLTEGVSPLALALLKGFDGLAYSVACPEPGEVDWADPVAVRKLVDRVKPSLIINTLQWASRGLSLSQLEAHQALAAIGQELDLTLIHISSYEVFSSSSYQVSHGEQDIPEPDTPLGVALREAEASFLQVPRGIVLRLSWVFDEPNGLLEAVCKGLQTASIAVSDSCRGCPTSLADTARAIVAIVQQISCGAENWGVMHFRSSDSCSEAEFADGVVKIMKKAGCPTGAVNVVPIEQRLMPSSGWLAGQRCTNNFGIQLRSWRHMIQHPVSAWLDEDAQVKNIEDPDDYDSDRRVSVPQGR